MNGIMKKNNSLQLLKSYMNTNPNIGESLLDGGERIKYLHQYLGTAKYIKLLDSVFE